MRIALNASSYYNEDQLIYDALAKHVTSNDIILLNHKGSNFQDIVESMCQRMGINYIKTVYPTDEADIIIEFINGINKYIVCDRVIPNESN